MVDEKSKNYLKNLIFASSLLTFPNSQTIIPLSAHSIVLENCDETFVFLYYL